MNDPTNSEQVEAVDHADAARRLIQRRADGSLPRCDETDTAQVHATLALVDEVRVLRETVGTRVDEVERAIRNA